MKLLHLIFTSCYLPVVSSSSQLCSKHVLYGFYSKSFPGEITGSCGTMLFHVLFNCHWLSFLSYLERWLHLIHFLCKDYKLLPCISRTDHFFSLKKNQTKPFISKLLFGNIVLRFQITLAKPGHHSCSALLEVAIN